MVGAKLRTSARLPVFDGSSSIVKSPQKGVEAHPLLVIGTVPPQLTFLRTSDDGRSLLFSKLPNEEVAQCTRVVELRQLRAVNGLSRHSFELKLVGLQPGPSIRLETHDAFSCKQWVLRLGSSVQTTDTSHAFPSRSTPPEGLRGPSGAFVHARAASPRSPLYNHVKRTTSASTPADPNLNVASALTRGWHVNTGQHGLQRLRELSPRGAHVNAPAARTASRQGVR